MATKKPDDTQDQAPEQGAFLMHMDDFLNQLHDEIKTKTGQVHIESISAFAKANKALSVIKQTESKWRNDYEKFLNSVPS